MTVSLMARQLPGRGAHLVPLRGGRRVPAAMGLGRLQLQDGGAATERDGAGQREEREHTGGTSH